MTYNPQKHNRQSNRLKGYDYASPGRYFVTICVQNRECRFGEITNGDMVVNAAGQMIDKWWQKVPEKFPNARLDVYQIMPNHFHAIIAITNARNTIGVDQRVSPDKGNTRGGHAGPRQPNFEPKPASRPPIVQWFKTMTTNRYIQDVKAGRFLPFDRRLWQRNYYDHIMRDKSSLQRIRYYIINNPDQWQNDRHYPKN